MCSIYNLFENNIIKATLSNLKKKTAYRWRNISERSVKPDLTAADNLEARVLGSEFIRQINYIISISYDSYQCGLAILRFV